MTTGTRKRYAIVGMGGRSAMYSAALIGDFKDDGALVGFCDVNQTRMDFYNRTLIENASVAPIPCAGRLVHPSLCDTLVRVVEAAQDRDRADAALPARVGRTGGRCAGDLLL